MEQITLAVSGARLGSWDAAGSIRSSKARGHIELGHLWFFPEGQPCLPHIVEHELAHIERNDSRCYVTGATAEAGLIVAGAGLLSLLHAAAAVLLVLAARTAWSWWTELACDAAAARRCGRAASATVLSQLLAADRSVPLLVRLRQLPFALRTHPPLRLRHWWIGPPPGQRRADQSSRSYSLARGSMSARPYSAGSWSPCRVNSLVADSRRRHRGGFGVWIPLLQAA